jgi:hypothetical protein
MTQFYGKRLNLETHDNNGMPLPAAPSTPEATLEEIARFQEEAVIYPDEPGVPSVNFEEVRKNAETVLVQGKPMKEVFGIAETEPTTQFLQAGRGLSVAESVAGIAPASSYLPPYLHRRDRFQQQTSNGLTFLGNRARAELGEQPIDVYVGQGYYSAQELYEIANLAQKLAGVLYPGIKSAKLSSGKAKTKKKAKAKAKPKAI